MLLLGRAARSISIHPCEQVSEFHVQLQISEKTHSTANGQLPPHRGIRLLLAAGLFDWNLIVWVWLPTRIMKLLFKAILVSVCSLGNITVPKHYPTALQIQPRRSYWWRQVLALLHNLSRSFFFFHVLNVKLCSCKHMPVINRNIRFLFSTFSSCLTF